MRRVIAVASLSLLLLITASGRAAVAAKTPPLVSVAPFLQQVQVKGDNDSQNFDVSYSNDSDRPQALTLSVVDFGSLDEAGGVAFAGPSLKRLAGQYSLSRWLSLSQNSLDLQPRQKTTVRATITNDGTMSPGGHYAAIIATVISPDSHRANKVVFKQQLSSLVFAVKLGGERYDLKLTSTATNGSLFKLPDIVMPTMQSAGNVHVVPRGIVYLKEKGKLVSRGVLNPESGLVLPGTKRQFSVNMHRLTAPRWWPHSLSLQIDYRYDGYDNFATKSVNIYYVPPLFCLTIIALLVLVVYAGRRYLS